MAHLKRSDPSNASRSHCSTALLDPPAETDANDSTGRTDFDATDRMYIVAEGDTLSSIARKFYGNAVARRRILEANWRVIGDPFMMPPGLRLRIPY